MTTRPKYQGTDGEGSRREEEKEKVREKKNKVKYMNYDLHVLYMKGPSYQNIKYINLMVCLISPTRNPASWSYSGPLI